MISGLYLSHSGTLQHEITIDRRDMRKVSITFAMLRRAMQEHNHQPPTSPTHRQLKEAVAAAGGQAGRQLRSFACLHDFGLL